MPNQPLINAMLTITVDSVAKVFIAVTALNFNYNTGMVNVVDATGSFYFSIKTITALTYVITTGVNGTHTVVTS